MDSSNWPMGDHATALARDLDGEPLWGPAVVCSSISRDDFVRWLESGDAAPRRWRFEPNTNGVLGRVVVYSGATLVHQRTASAIVASVRDQVTQLGEDPALNSALRAPASLVCRLEDHLLAPDDALVPSDAAKHSLPTLVVEIAYANETRAMLHSRLARWLRDGGGTVQVAIGVKIYAASQRRTIVVLQRGQPMQSVELGTRGVAKWPATTIATFPLGALFRGFALPPALRGLEREPIMIDPDDVRAVVQRAIKRRP